MGFKEKEQQALVALSWNCLDKGTSQGELKGNLTVKRSVLGKLSQCYRSAIGQFPANETHASGMQTKEEIPILRLN